jgi:protease-4
MNLMSDTKSETTEPGKKTDNWERGVLERVALAAVQEQRRARRWGIFFKLFFAAYLLVLLVMVYGDQRKPGSLSKNFTALIEMDGTIAPDSPATADNVIGSLRAAFEAKNTAGIVLRANSPGGSPVQAGYIYDEIVRLREKHPDIPVYAVITDVCASGCYYAVAAADKIYADKASIVGSIGVLMNGFGFVDGMKKLGIERRLLTAGEHKGFLDPFSAMKPQDKAHAQKLLNNIHKQFIERVREGRGDALKETKDMFTGLFWTGEEAVGMGLVDEIGSASYVAREVVGAEEIVDFTQRENVFDRFAKRLGTAMAEKLGTDILGRTPVMK